MLAIANKFAFELNMNKRRHNSWNTKKSHRKNLTRSLKSITVGACKVNKAIIENIKELDSNECKISITPNYKRFTKYTVGETLKSEIFDENPFSEFDTGIKCFIHKADAIKNTQ